MTLAELFSELQALNETDKLRVIQFLADDLATNRETFFEEGKSYPVWSPYGTEAAATTLEEMLKAGHD